MLDSYVFFLYIIVYNFHYLENKSCFAGIPASEKFSFCLNTLLSDIATRHADLRDEIISAQVDLMNNLTKHITECHESKENALSKLQLCKSTIPVLIGLARSMGRFCINNPPLLCRIFPEPDHPVKPKSSDYSYHQLNSNKKRSFNHFRSIIPRSLSGNLNPSAVEALTANINGDTVDSLNGTNTLNKRSLQSHNSIPYDPTTYFFTKYGSSFNQFPNMRFTMESPEKRAVLQFPVMHLQTILALAKKLLVKDLLNYLDEEAEDIFASGQIQVSIVKCMFIILMNIYVKNIFLKFSDFSL